MTDHLHKLIQNLDDEQKEGIVGLLSFHITDLYDKKEWDIDKLHSQYRSLIRQYFVPYNDNSEYQNIREACNKAYQKLQTYD